jgi:hypothetical protein
MFLCLAKTDDVRLIASLRVIPVHHDTVKSCEQIDPLLPIGLAGIFPGDNRSVESRFETKEIESMVPDGVASLRVVPLPCLYCRYFDALHAFFVAATAAKPATSSRMPASWTICGILRCGDGAAREGQGIGSLPLATRGAKGKLDLRALLSPRFSD